MSQLVYDSKYIYISTTISIYDGNWNITITNIIISINFVCLLKYWSSCNSLHILTQLRIKLTVFWYFIMYLKVCVEVWSTHIVLLYRTWKTWMYVISLLLQFVCLLIKSIDPIDSIEQKKCNDTKTFISETRIESVFDLISDACVWESVIRTSLVNILSYVKKTFAVNKRDRQILNTFVS